MSWLRRWRWILFGPPLHQRPGRLGQWRAQAACSVCSRMVRYKVTVGCMFWLDEEGETIVRCPRCEPLGVVDNVMEVTG